MLTSDRERGENGPRKSERFCAERRYFVCAMQVDVHLFLLDFIELPRCIGEQRECAQQHKHGAKREPSHRSGTIVIVDQKAGQHAHVNRHRQHGLQSSANSANANAQISLRLISSHFQADYSTNSPSFAQIHLSSANSATNRIVKLIVPPAMKPFTKRPMYSSVAFVASNINDQLHYLGGRKRWLQCCFFFGSVQRKYRSDRCFSMYRMREYHNGQRIFPSKSVAH